MYFTLKVVSYIIFSGTLLKENVIQLFHSPGSEVPAILKKFVSKEATSEAAILKLYLAARLCLCNIILSDSKLAGRKKTCK